MKPKILVGTDTSAAADLAVEAAAGLARTRQAELLVVHVRGDGAARDAADPKKPADPDGYLARIAARFPGLAIRSWSERGDPAERLVEVAENERVDTIVVGNRGPTALGGACGTACRTSSFVTRRARCSSWTLGRRSKRRFRSLRAGMRARPSRDGAPQAPR